MLLIAVGLIVLISMVLPAHSGGLGRYLPDFLLGIFGWAAYLFPILFIILGLQLIYLRNTLPLYWLIMALFIFLVTSSTAFSLFKPQLGGAIGEALEESLGMAVGKASTVVIVILVGLVDLLLITQLSLKQLVDRFAGWIGQAGEMLSKSRDTGPAKKKSRIRKPIVVESEEEGAFFDFTDKTGRGAVTAPTGMGHYIEIETAAQGEEQAALETGRMPADGAVREVVVPPAPAPEPFAAGGNSSPSAPRGSGSIPGPPAAPVLAGGPAQSAALPAAGAPAAAPLPGQMELFPGRNEAPGRASAPRRSGSRAAGIADSEGRVIKYRLPSFSLLRGLPKEVRKRAPSDYSEVLQDTLASFGVEVRILNILRGPTVTRYELQPAKGVKVSRITNLANDIALTLAAPSIRIEAPIPGKSAIGIEVPNQCIDPVHVKEILESPAHRKGGLLSFALGKDITGHPVVGDLSRMPHLLIAGATGSGKTVCLNSIMASLLYKASPDQVQFLIIDPKRVELIIYEGIPHIIDAEGNGDRKVVTSAQLATKVLKWLTMEMDRRYDAFADARCKNLPEYNLRMTREGKLHLPFVVLVIDELADLMMLAASTVEASICRLAQLGRAAGIHLMVATQRPSVDVITGIIKANIPSRVAFAVSSQVDSRTILDEVGAEKLLGKGDMLYKPIDAPDPRRIQGAYIDSEEIEKLVEFWESQPDPPNKVQIVPRPGEEEMVEEEELNEEDDLFQEAINVVRRTRQASASMLQRKLKVGYARAGRLIDFMERKGLVGPAEGSKPRKILFRLDDDNGE